MSAELENSFKIIESLDKKIDKFQAELKRINAVKDTGIANLEETKILLKKILHPNLMKKTVPPSIKRIKTANNIDRIVALIDREISLMQNKHDELIQDIKIILQMLYDKNKCVEKCKNRKDMINYKFHEFECTYHQNLNKLRQEQMELMREHYSNFGETVANKKTNLVLKLSEIKKKVEDNHNNFQEALKSLNYQMEEIDLEENDLSHIQEKYKEIVKKHYKNYNLLLLSVKENLEDNELVKKRINSLKLPPVQEAINLNNVSHLANVFQCFCNILVVKYYQYL